MRKKPYAEIQTNAKKKFKNFKLIKKSCIDNCVFSIYLTCFSC